MSSVFMPNGYQIPWILAEIDIKLLISSLYVKSLIKGKSETVNVSHADEPRLK